MNIKNTLILIKIKGAIFEQLLKWNNFFNLNQKGMLKIKFEIFAMYLLIMKFNTGGNQSDREVLIKFSTLFF